MPDEFSKKAMRRRRMHNIGDNNLSDVCLS